MICQAFFLNCEGLFLALHNLGLVARALHQMAQAEELGGNHVVLLHEVGQAIDRENLDSDVLHFFYLLFFFLCDCIVSQAV